MGLLSPPYQSSDMGRAQKAMSLGEVSSPRQFTSATEAISEGSELKVICSRYSSSVTGSKLILLAPRQADKSGGEVLGQGRATLFGKPRRWQTRVLENHLPRVWMLVSFIEQRGGR